MATASANLRNAIFFFVVLSLFNVHVCGSDGCLVVGCGYMLTQQCWCCYSANVKPPLQPEDICFATKGECEAFPCPPLPPGRDSGRQKEPIKHTIQCIVTHPDPEISGFLHKGFSQITKEVVGRALHAVYVKGGTYLSVFHSNTLINMYSKFGKINAAKNVFDEMLERNEASWNNMISGYVTMGLYVDAGRLFIEMWGRGFKLNGYVIASLLTAFSRSESMVLEGLQIHGLVLKNGLLYDVFVGTSLLHFYGMYGIISSARTVFEEMPHRNVVSWTSLMVDYSDAGDFNEVVKLYRRMRCEGISCNQNTFTTVISSCGALDDEFLGHQVLGHVLKSGIESNVSVANSIISMFGNFSSVEDACYVFNHMDERDIISWNSMITVFANNWLCNESLRCFHLMRLDHGEINATTLSAVLVVCGSLDNLKWGRGIHCLVVKLGWDSNVCISNTLLTMYFQSGRHKDAEKLFNRMAEKDLISWNSMMTGYVLEGKCLDALKVLNELLDMGKMMNFVTFASALAACSDAEFLVEGRIIHSLVIISGFHQNLVVGNALVTMYGRCGMMQVAKRVFQMMPEKELVTWNALIGGYADNEECDEALETFKLLRQEAESPNYITLINVLGSFWDPGNLLKCGMPLHAYIILTGFETDEYVKNSLITMYADCGDLNSSNHMFYGLLNKTPVTWNAMVAANAQHSQWEEALKLLLEMQRTKVNFDQFSLSAGHAASANLGILVDGQHLHSLAIKLGFDAYHYVKNATMDMYGKCGEMNDLLKMLPEPKRRSRLSWNILLSSFARHGYFQRAKDIFHEMLEQGAKPDHVTFVSLLSACSHGGLVDEGLAYFASMTTEFGVPVAIEHCVCIVDLLGRSGRLAEAEKFIDKMPVQPNDFVWRSLLAACKTHGHVELGKKAAENILKSNPSDDSAYVLYSNVCATSGRWQDVQRIRVKMESENVKKKPACSWLNVRNKISMFGVGDQSHPQAEQIYIKLMELRKKIKEEGYVPDTSYALHDTDDEQKEDNLWNHSERLALAYGLIHTPEDSTLRIFKNLRVCGDCHSVYKLVSNIVRRVIILRDPYRFHHFSSGKCSCGDYW
ncbi:Tetratricopeptide repeat (TPR)-like superfamily protein [Abeliophyllum distichum]|uniref:Tetratricopeptide repeat (TPR)-like superfamily protein n=1 Tax=Abeliophyllum distichum TaxID=126358 RepID=A0ABD1UFV1_9LAMI